MLLARYDLDVGGFNALDQITDFAAALCDAPIALPRINPAMRPMTTR